jgi:hypothetical protein
MFILYSVILRMTERSVKKRKIKKQRGGEEIVLEEPYKNVLPNIVKNIDTQNDANLQNYISKFNQKFSELEITISTINENEQEEKKLVQQSAALVNENKLEQRKADKSGFLGTGIGTNSKQRHLDIIIKNQKQIDKNTGQIDSFHEIRNVFLAKKPILENILQELVKTIRLQKIIVDINTHNKWTIQNWTVEQRIIQYNAIVKSMKEILSTLLIHSNLVTLGGGIDNINRYNTFLANDNTSAKLIIQEFSEIAKNQSNEYGITQKDVNELSLAWNEYNDELEKSKYPRSGITEQMVDNSKIDLEMKYNELRHKLKLINYFNIADNIIPDAINPEIININELFTKYDKYMQLGYAEIKK